MPRRRARRRRLGDIVITITGVGVFAFLVLALLLSPAVSVRSPEPPTQPSGHDPRLAGEILLGLLVAAVLARLARAAVRRAGR
jgi:hypothetical protein